MLESALTSNVFIVSHMLATRFPSNILVRLLGVWEVRHAIKYNMISELTVIVRCSPWKTPQLVVTSGIAYYMSPPHTIKEILDPIHTAIYITFMLSACALLSKTYEYYQKECYMIPECNTYSKGISLQLERDGMKWVRDRQQVWV